MTERPQARLTEPGAPADGSRVTATAQQDETLQVHDVRYAPTRTERAARVLERLRIGHVARRVGLWKGVLVLNYHRMGTPDGSGFARSLWSATAEDFDAQLRMLTRNFDVVSPDDVADRPEAPGRRVLLTFDDGYSDNHEIALPALRRHGVHATFFVVPGFLDHPGVAWWDDIAWMVDNAEVDVLALREHGLIDLDLSAPVAREEASDLLAHVYKGLAGDRTGDFLELLAERTGAGRCPSGLGADLWMSWDQVRDLRDAGMTIGGHSFTHPVLARLDREQQALEIDRCAERMREELGVAMDYFSYPVGLDDAYDLTTRELLEQAGVRLAFAYTGGYSDGAVQDCLAVPRASVSHVMGIERFAATITLPQLFARW